MNYLNESLAHESGLELDDVYADNNELTKADIQFECSNCGTISADFEDMECDGDIWGICPNCKEYCMVFDLSKELNNDYQILNS